MIDSRADLGINSRDDNLIQWRRTATCSPITTDGYVKSGTSSIMNTTVKYKAAFYGQSGFSTKGLNDSAVDNATYVYTNFRQFALTDGNAERSIYDL